MIVIVASLDTLPLAIVATPLPFDVRLLARDLMLTRVPALLLISGLVSGKEVSFAIALKPPTSSTKAVTLLSTAKAVAILLLLDTHVSVLSRVSVSLD